MDEWLEKNVVIELKTSSKYFGKVISIDELFITLLDKKNKKQSFAKGEVARIEELP